MEFLEKKERELAEELNTTNPSPERMQHLLAELDLIRNVGAMTEAEKQTHEKELGQLLIRPDFNLETGKSVFKQLEILRHNDEYGNQLQ